MNLRLKGKVAVVLAGSSGIGLAVALKLAEEGCALAICSRSIDKLKAAKDVLENQKISVLACEADISKKESIVKFIAHVIDRYGRIDILVCNSGGPPSGNSMELEDDEYESAFQLLVMSKIRAIKLSLPSMIKNKWGRIISLESTSVKMAIDNMVLSNTFRVASSSFIKSISGEYGHLGIRAHSILTGPFVTDRLYEIGMKESSRLGIEYKDWVDLQRSKLPLGRFGEVSEIGGLVAFLASPLTDYMNGTSIPIDGGILKSVI